MLKITGKDSVWQSKILKHIVLLTARVHPDEVPSSHSINGVIKFLCDKLNLFNILEMMLGRIY